MSILADRQYTLNDFNKIKHESNIIELDKYTIKIINKLANKVGAPNYIKTPVFKKNRHYKKDKYKTVNKVVSDQVFKTTELHKGQSNVEAEFDKIRLLLNKLTFTMFHEVFKLSIFVNII